MGSACAKNKVAVNEVIEDVKTDKPNGDITEVITDVEDKTSKIVEKPIKELEETSDHVSNSIKDSESLCSGDSGSSSRPATPFSRPVTAAVIQRPKTTTIYEKGPDEEVKGEEISEITLPPPHRSVRRSVSRGSLEGGEFHFTNRKLSRQATDDSEDIRKLQEYLSQKGL